MLKTGVLVNEFVPDPKVGLREQITRFMRKLIVTGELRSGHRLPSTQSLARRWGVQVSTVHEALVPLVHEGMLVRTPRRGTFVRKRPAKLACIGIYETSDYNRLTEAVFTRGMLALLTRKLAGAGIRTRLWIEHRPQNESANEPMQEIVDACRRGEIQGVIAASPMVPQTRWLSQLPVPVAFDSPEPLPNAVMCDFCQFAEAGLETLSRQGCRSVGLIAPWPTSEEAVTLHKNLYAQVYERFFDVAGRLRLALRDDWIQSPVAPQHVSNLSFEHYGHERFKALWKKSPHPDGLIVADDVMAKGVITALLEARVHVPADLKLVLHRNREIGLLCPMPATFLESSLAAMAEALFDQVRKQFNGQVCERVLLPFRLERGKIAPYRVGRSVVNPS